MSFASKFRKKEASLNLKFQISNLKLVLVLDDVYDTYNVGGMYRVADAAGVSHIYHCGGTPMPPDPKIARSSVGLWQYIPHSHCAKILTLVTQLKKEGYTIVALEQDEKAKPFNQITFTSPTALIVGNETFGVHKNILNTADTIVELPMYGINHSVNVVVATGIVLYQIRHQWS